MPLLAVAALSVLLSACFSSESRNSPRRRRSRPSATAGAMSCSSMSATASSSKQRTLTVKQTLDGSLRIRWREDDSADLVPRRRQRRHRRPGQAGRNNKHAYGYLILTRKGKELLLHLPQCDKQDPAVLAANGVVHRDKCECSIDKVSDPAKLFAALDPGRADHQDGPGMIMPRFRGA